MKQYERHEIVDEICEKMTDEAHLEDLQKFFYGHQQHYLDNIEDNDLLNIAIDHGVITEDEAKLIDANGWPIVAALQDGGPTY